MEEECKSYDCQVKSVPSLKECPQPPLNTWIAIYLIHVLGGNQSCAIA
jgi:hypothetical protein